ncbi:putative DNA-binding protein [Listeria ilorinensis]|uniref:putative DNA-binding protein n=1 Tax=Listeria ilorinensis TaxID=2867439 RepID=UPI001EF5AFC7|nr:putative DNA-binding protein [Listeria ilorinensis]
MFEKTTRMNLLFDFYQGLLTEKQKAYIALYYLDDFSLGEIAEEFEVSRQAVYDNIKRTEESLEKYEEKLGMLTMYLEREKLFDELTVLLQEEDAYSEKIETLLGALRKTD